ncbi:ATPase [Thiohalobacter thiocyanaticus]|uniref:ATPase n=1 Tax=Thiohalobacter thiocyanaticus TaxID=585455 RepID=A0A1Z4VS42_9GAMM|nr:hypothetical protein [Thiohalobacter thiocyanaticus]BAZ94295.1 ATPase [Thiohalobacter thiocyanaticus]
MKQDATQCRQFTHRLRLEDLPPRYRRHVRRLEQREDGSRAIQLRATARHDPELREFLYLMVGIKLVPVQPVALSEPEPRQEAPRRQAGGNAA